MSREERQALLHDSSASVSATLSAFVEIVFDNSDGRFPHGSSNELTLRRTIGIKKDEYSLDGRSTTKQDVLNMLEAAGFSRANPYYIVPQGRVRERKRVGCKNWRGNADCIPTIADHSLDQHERCRSSQLTERRSWYESL